MLKGLLADIDWTETDLKRLSLFFVCNYLAMQTILFIAALAILAQGPTPIPGQLPSGDKAQIANQAESTKQGDNSARNAPSSGNQAPIPNKQIAATGEDRATEDSNKKVQEKIANYTLILAIVGGLQVLALFIHAFVFCRTLGAVNRQADILKDQTAATERSALAAGKNADAATEGAKATTENTKATINIERAWLIPTKIIPPEINPHQYLIQRARDSGEKQVAIIAEIMNYGGTPAWITKQFCNSGVLDESGEWRLNYRDGLPVAVIGEKPIEPRGGEPHKLLAVHKLDDASRAAIPKGLFYVYGFVEYRDVFGKQRESYFCWQYSIFNSGIGEIGIWTPAGPREANRYT